MATDDTLEQLLDQIRLADRGTRIELRDSVIKHGSDAIGPMVEWLDDREFAAFAIRVLERIGQVDSHRRLVIEALVDAHSTAPTPAIAGRATLREPGFHPRRR